ncbi:MAG: transposase family protein [Deltaproteobacteria bacterium]|nr:transposase family protein [Deltaproteobacteria bacterium]
MFKIDFDNPLTLSVIMPKRDSINHYFEHILGISMPFYVDKISYEKEKENENEKDETHVYVEYHKALRFTSPCCKEKESQRKRVHARTWRALNMGNNQTYIHMNLPSVKCNKCGKTQVIDVPWARKSCNFTYEFEQKIVAYAEYMPNSAIAKTLEESDKVISDIMQYNTSKQD